jgi:hypothetical protein
MAMPAVIIRTMIRPTNNPIFGVKSLVKDGFSFILECLPTENIFNQPRSTAILLGNPKNKTAAANRLRRLQLLNDDH